MEEGNDVDLRIVPKARKGVPISVKLTAAVSGAIGAEKGRVRSSREGKADSAPPIPPWFTIEN